VTRIDYQSGGDANFLREMLGVEQPIERAGTEDDFDTRRVREIARRDVGSGVEGVEDSVDESVSSLSRCLSCGHFEVKADKRVKPQRRVKIAWVRRRRLGVEKALGHGGGTPFAAQWFHK
jgi:hypothetical protein